MTQISCNTAPTMSIWGRGVIHTGMSPF